MHPTHKDVTVEGTAYQIARISAADGNWILGRWTEKWQERSVQAARSAPQSAPHDAEGIATAPEGAAEPTRGNVAAPTHEEGALAMASFLIARLSREELATVQEICLLRCSRYEEAAGRQVPMPIMVGPGRWAVADLEYNGPVVLRLMQESVAFNIAPYFIGAGSHARK